jgi:hypothetical protein
LTRIRKAGTELKDFGQNTIRLRVVDGAEFAHNYRGKPRTIWVAINQRALDSRLLFLPDFAQNIVKQHPILPSCIINTGSKDCRLARINGAHDCLDQSNMSCSGWPRRIHMCHYAYFLIYKTIKMLLSLRMALRTLGSTSGD